VKNTQLVGRNVLIHREGGDTMVADKTLASGS